MFQAIYNNGMTIREVSQTALDTMQSPYERMRNTFDSVPLHNTLDDCIQWLGSYSKPTTLPDGSSITPCDINYPAMASPFHVLRLRIWLEGIRASFTRRHISTRLQGNYRKRCRKRSREIMRRYNPRKAIGNLVFGLLFILMQLGIVYMGYIMVQSL